MTVLAFLKNHIAAATEHYDVSVVANTADAGFLRGLGLVATLHPVEIVRPISLWQDLSALRVLVGLFRQHNFDIVHSVSPKAGLLAMFAAMLAGVRHRVHTFTGQVWVTRRGWRRWMLRKADALLASLTSRILVDSPSQREFLVSEGVFDADKAEVIGKGSICGVDSARFHPDSEERRTLRDTLGIPQSDPVLLFLGRLNRDKGVLDLVEAFAALAQRFPEPRLLLVGPDEDGLAERIAQASGAAAGRVQRIDYTAQPERYMAAADIFCLPSYREGFGQVLVEAAAAGLPAVASRIYGITDAVVEGETGLLHPPGDVVAIQAALAQLICDAPRRAAMGERARRRALAEFSQAESTQGLMAFYGKMLD
jgi:glycosyltransferase involved in cell wall biosynthesis